MENKLRKGEIIMNVKSFPVPKTLLLRGISSRKNDGPPDVRVCNGKREERTCVRNVDVVTVRREKASVCSFALEV